MTHPLRLAAHALLFTSALLLINACNGSDGNGGGGPVVQQGADLGNVPPTNTMACQDGFVIQTNATFPQPTYLTGNSSCLVLTFFPGAQPPAGTVVSANIFVGPVTGPMRFVRMRILVQNRALPNNGVEAVKACCSVEELGQVFTPAPNSISTVALNFRMTADHAPNDDDLTTIAAADLVGLEILAPNVPIPGNWINNGGPVLTLPNYIWFPAITARTPVPLGQNLRSEGSYSGFLPSYNLNIRAASGASPNPLGNEN